MITKSYPRPKKPVLKPEKIKKIPKRRRCKLKTCNQLYRPVKANQKFCSVDHKTEYHFHTPDFRKLEQEFIRMVRRMVRPECLK